LKIWQIVVLGFVAMASIWGGYNGYNRFVVGETKAAAIQGQTATVTRGSLRAMVSASGSAVVIRQTKLSFGTAGSLGEIGVKMGDSVKAGQVLAKLDPSTMATLQNSVIQAEANVNIAKMDLETALNPYTAVDLSVAERTVRQAEAGLDVATQDLEDVQNPYSELDFSLAEAAVRNAAAALEAARRTLGLAENDPSSNDSIRTQEDQASYYVNVYNRTRARFEDGAVSQQKLDGEYSNMLLAQEKLAAAREKKEMAVATARNEVAKAQDALAKSQDDLEKKQAGAEPKVVEKQRSMVISAETALEKARDDLSKKLAGPDARTVEKMRNQVISVQAALETAREKLKGSAITAPFDGIVASTALNPGEQVAANTVILTLLDPEALRIDVSVSENDIASLRPGQAAMISFDALAGQTFQARVDSISPAAKVQQGVVNYPVALTLDRGSGVKDGMTASAQIVHQQKDNILLVPNRAIRTQGRNRTVQVLLPNGSTETRTVRVGMANDQSSEVMEGLAEGEQVVIPTTTTTTRGVPGAGGFNPGAQGFGPGGPAFMVKP